jgi:hypothetical protein
MKVTVYSLTTDGDNLGIETGVYATEEEARAEIIAGLEKEGHRRGKDGFKLSAASNDELRELWEDEFDGCCKLEAHTIDAVEIEPVEVRT